MNTIVTTTAIERKEHANRAIHNQRVAKLLGLPIEATAPNDIDTRVALLLMLARAYAFAARHHDISGKQVPLASAISAEEEALCARLPIVTQPQALLIRAAIAFRGGRE